MTKESAIELQKVDCNCNDCGHLVRDISRYKLSDQFHEKLQFEVFTRDKNTQLFIGYTLRDKTILAKAMKQVFQSKKPPVSFGYCKKFDFKQISFIPNTIQLETQTCFIHRKDYQS